MIYALIIIVILLLIYYIYITRSSKFTNEQIRVAYNLFDTNANYTEFKKIMNVDIVDYTDLKEAWKKVPSTNPQT